MVYGLLALLVVSAGPGNKVLCGNTFCVRGERTGD